MSNQPTDIERKRRMATVKKGLIEAGIQGMQTPEILALLRVNEPTIKQGTLSVWITQHHRQLRVRRNADRTGGAVDGR